MFSGDISERMNASVSSSAVVNDRPTNEKTAREEELMNEGPLDSNGSSLVGCRVLVTGGCGMLGHQVVSLLSKRQVKEIIVYDINADFENKEWQDEAPPINPNTRVTVVCGNVCDVTALMDICRGVDVVFHLAAIVDISPAPNPVIFDVNVGGTQNVIDSCLANNVKVLVATSSVEVAGVGQPFRENEPPPPPRDETSPAGDMSNVYAKTKRQSERLVLLAHGSRTANGHTLSTVCIRPGLVVDKIPGNISLSDVLERASQAGGVFHFYKIPVSLSFVHARNAALAHICAAERHTKSEVGGKAFLAVDFDANITNVYQEIFSEVPGIHIMMLPQWLAMSLLWCLHLCFLLMNSLAAFFFNYRLKRSIWFINYHAVKITFHDFCFTDALARKHLEYKSPSQNGGIQVKTRTETIEDAKIYTKKYYSQLKQQSLTYPFFHSWVSLFRAVWSHIGIVVSLFKGKF